MSLGSRLGSILTRAARSRTVRRAARDLGRSAADALRNGEGGGSRGDGHRSRGQSPEQSHGTPRGQTGGSAGEHAVLRDRSSSPAPAISYAPSADGDADPGEIVWAWVHFEEDIAQGKDRPVLVLALEDASVGGADGSGQAVVALMLTSRDRGQGTHTDEHGATWVDIGTGSWDSQHRPSEVRVDRLLRIPASAVRREGARVDRDRFDAVVAEARRVHGWSN
ncbi:type II toxin-antitoxin system PemK/MazF family toxin [Brachybacterium sp. MASK1Z-5]|uniref:Type II toxin-antitoxin system PemK/MazF family toxin n=1 Tax=Brachybacterium halotolerans TaxID=2795215 RepID=A0ABS1B687_9MICO|nr:type II toxin-antitoxin system PemK/MazF family toxin [Brachybacterium halotolerans]MBK0330166.1 type II toxin-antitoxin system PemK/MazF family toxin [Brachybacterium halotolerans]